MGKKFEAKIIDGSSSSEMVLGFQFVNNATIHLAYFEVRGTSLDELTAKRFTNAEDIRIDVRPIKLEYEDGSYTGINVGGFIDEKCVVEQLCGRPFVAYYNPYKLDGDCGWLVVYLPDEA